jgi:cell division topological specificity factor
MDFLDRLLGKSKKSGDVAKERLQLVLIHDRAKLSPGKMEEMRNEIIDVISKYVEIDSQGIEISLTNTEREQRLIADIPLLSKRQSHLPSSQS